MVWLTPAGTTNIKMALSVGSVELAGLVPDLVAEPMGGEALLLVEMVVKPTGAEPSMFVETTLVPVADIMGAVPSPIVGMWPLGVKLLPAAGLDVSEPVEIRPGFFSRLAAELSLVFGRVVKLMGGRLSLRVGTVEEPKDAAVLIPGGMVG